MQTAREDNKDFHPMLRPKLDSRFSFNTDERLDDLRTEIDPVHKAVGREPWYQVSCVNRDVVH